MRELAVFRIPEPFATKANEALDQLHDDLKVWVDGAMSSAQEKWGRDAILLQWRTNREVYGIEDVPWEDRPNRHQMPTKEWKRTNVPDGWERLVDHGNKPEALRPRLKATKDWVKEWTKKAPDTAHRVVAKVLGIHTDCFYGLRLTSFGYEDFGEHGSFLSWPADMIEFYANADPTSNDNRDPITNYVPVYADRVPLSEYYAAKEAHESEEDEDA